MKNKPLFFVIFIISIMRIYVVYLLESCCVLSGRLRRVVPLREEASWPHAKPVVEMLSRSSSFPVLDRGGTPTPAIPKKSLKQGIKKNLRSMIY